MSSPIMCMNHRDMFIHSLLFCYKENKKNENKHVYDFVDFLCHCCLSSKFAHFLIIFWLFYWFSFISQICAFLCVFVCVYTWFLFSFFFFCFFFFLCEMEETVKAVSQIKFHAYNLQEWKRMEIWYSDWMVWSCGVWTINEDLWSCLQLLLVTFGCGVWDCSRPVPCVLACSLQWPLLVTWVFVGCPVCSSLELFLIILLLFTVHVYFCVYLGSFTREKHRADREM